MFGMLIYSAAAVAETIADAMLIELGNKYDDINIKNIKSKLQTQAMIVRCVASLVASTLSIGLLTFCSTRLLIGLSCIFFVGGIVSVVIFSTEDSFSVSVQENSQHLCSFRKWELIQPLILIFIYYSIPNFEDTYDSYLADQFTFSDWQFTDLLGSLLGALFYWKFLSNRKLKFVFIISILLSTLCNSMVFLLIARMVNDLLFIPCFSFLTSFFNSISTIPPLILASLYITKNNNFEGTIFSIFLMIIHLGSLVSSVISAQLTSALDITKTNWDQLWLFVLICLSCELLPLIGLWRGCAPSNPQ